MLSFGQRSPLALPTVLLFLAAHVAFGKRLPLPALLRSETYVRIQTLGMRSSYCVFNQNNFGQPLAPHLIVTSVCIFVFTELLFDVLSAMANSLLASLNVATKSWRQELEPHVNSNNRYFSVCVEVPVFFQPRKRLGSQPYVWAVVHHPGVGRVVVMLDAVADADHSCLCGYLVVKVCVADRLRQEGVVLRELLVGGVRVAFGHGFTLPAGIFRISHVVVNMSASLVSGCTVSLVFDAPCIEVAARGPTQSDDDDSEVYNFDQFHKAAIREYLLGDIVLS